MRNKRKLAAVTRETQEEHPRNGQSRNTSVSRINEEYITQFFEEIEGRVTKKLSQDFSQTEFRNSGALSKLDEILLNPQIRTHPGTVPGTFRNTNVENQGTNEDDSQSDPHPEASILRSQTTQNSGPEDGHDSLRTSAVSRTIQASRKLPAGAGKFPPVTCGNRRQSLPAEIFACIRRYFCLRNKIAAAIAGNFARASFTV